MSSSVAVVIPVGGVDEVFSTQLRAVLAQQLDTEFTVMLSVNTDAPAALIRLEEILGELDDPRIGRVDSSDVRGAAHARNAGVHATTADLITFCDADDLVHGGWLAALVAGLQDADAVTGRVIDVFVSERMATWYPPTTPGRLPTFLGEPYILTGNLGVRREAFESVGGFDETLTRCEDIALGWALGRKGLRLAYADDAVIDYRHRPGLRPMLRQHYLYGRGMNEVLARYGAPGSGASSPLQLMKPNAHRAKRRTLGGTARRGAIALGRARGLMSRRPAMAGADGRGGA